MASKSVLELAVGTGQWDSGLKKAKQALDNFTQANGGLQSALNKDSQSMQQFVKMMGQMDSTAKTAKGQMNDYKGTIEQLTMQYNRMTDAQKKTIGQDYLHAIDQMKQKYQGVAEEVQKINQSLKSMPEPAAQSGGGLFGGGKMSGMLQVFGGNVMTKLAGAGMGFVTEMGDMVKQGIELARAGEGIRIAFERLGRGDILDGLRKATHGTVTDLELMKAAVKFNDFKLPLDELGTMLAFAQQKAKDTGQSVDYMVDSIVTGLGRKSLMILDNLGLSAAEIKERMAETGDMTKAVGAIIREQMAKAGDYVETAADRAAQANVSLQNKMEELGRKFAPVEEASNQLWTSMKIGILEVVGGPLAKMLNSLTESGRLMNALSGNNGEQGSGNTKVDQQLNKLRGSNYKQFYYNKVVENYTKQINDLQAQINNGGKKPGAGSGTSQDVRYLTAQKQSLEVMRGLFKSGAKDIMQPVKVDTKTDSGNTSGGSTSTTTTTTPTTTTKSTPTNNTPTYAADSIAAQKALVSELTKQWSEAGADMRNGYLTQLIAAEETLKRMNNEATMFRENSAGRLLERGPIQTQANDLGMVTGSYKNYRVEGLSQETLEKLNNPQGKGDKKQTKDPMIELSKAINGLTSIRGGLEGMGIKLPAELEKGLNVLQGLMSIIQGVQAVISIFSTSTETANTIAVAANTVALGALTTAVTANTMTNFLPFAKGGVVKAANGYVDGTTYSGDQIPSLLNAGELVLNKAQQGVLAASLQAIGQGGEGGGGKPYVSGEMIWLGLTNYLNRSGRGEIVTSKRR